MENNLKIKFRCTFKVLCANNQYRIGSMYFVGTTEEDAKKKSKKVFRKNLQKWF